MHEVDYGDGVLPGSFWNKVHPEPNTGCWLWSGASDSFGYGNAWYSGGYIKAHRVMAMAAFGVDAENNVVMHSCDVPYCVNPSHLKWGTAKSNAEDMARKGRGRNQNVHKAHCKRGHEFTEANTMYRNAKAGQQRRCRSCHNTARNRPSRNANH